MTQRTWHEKRNTTGGVFVDSAPAQWDKATLQSKVEDFTVLVGLGHKPREEEKSDLLTLAGQLQRYGGEFYMGIASEVRQYLYANYQLSNGPYKRIR